MPRGSSSITWGSEYALASNRRNQVFPVRGVLRIAIRNPASERAVVFQ